MPLAKDQLLTALAGLRKPDAKHGFTHSVELIVKLREIDLKKPENRLNESIELPNSLGKETKICVIAGGDLATRARAGQADLVMGREDLDRLGKDKKATRKLASEYDYFIAEAPMMPLVGKTIGPILGPKGKMPTPVPPTAPIDQVVQSHRKLIRIRVRDQPVVQCRIGTEKMPDEEIAENAQAVFNRIEAKLERGAKNIRQVLVKTTMGEPVKVQTTKG
ncbi:MAG: 50S ribosomal protein L1 [Candidatus Bathyarchaeia archaeon]